MSELQQKNKTDQTENLKLNIMEMDKPITKHSIRTRVWQHFERNGISSFPRPVYGRIPNFKGCEDAAAKLSSIDAYNNCKNIEVNPDKPQEGARVLALENNKNLYVPVPRLKEGLLKHISLPKDSNVRLKQLVSRKGIEENGTIISIEDEVHIDFLVLGSVAVSKQGYRIGKGRGYADLEYAILREMGALDENTVIVTNVHDSQVFDTLPNELFQAYDVPVDYILTPTEVIEVASRLQRPPGIIWKLLSQRRVNLMPVLQQLKERHDRKGKDTTLKEVDTDVETNDAEGPRRRIVWRKRRRSLGKTSESQAEGDTGENAKPNGVPRRRRYYHRRRLPLGEERPNENGESASERPPQEGSVLKNRVPHQRLYRRNRLPIDFSLMISNIEKTVRVRELKNALNEKGIKPNVITWRGYRGVCYLHYTKPSPKTDTLLEPRQVDSVIEILQNMKIRPDLENQLSVKVMDRISRIETTDVTAV
ncbi:hypothetical protein PPYR_11761 [Photinus pyralis]|uniref:Methenyltetrahydrofolate synthase domain-containing protein n=1 Tax=Photinus pyralis TaxID=7054 RepID=A0A1Y1KN56_PHOPY|nr:methenyltetrahydrofolate synthase domain-containing protein [Photinus pyralis]KAB0794922.1 hypothetical protein PPYR_11761 [Photinus pyralis]